MPVYCVSYDLIDEKNYSDLYEKIKKYNHFRVLDSTWFIATEDRAPQIRDNLKEAMDDDDSLIVTEVIKHWASYNLIKGALDWLKKNL